MTFTVVFVGPGDGGVVVVVVNNEQSKVARLFPMRRLCGAKGVVCVVVLKS